MDVITGRTRPDAGEVAFRGGIDLTKLDEAAIANLGIGRKFQKPTVFESHSVFTNLELAQKAPRGPFPTLRAALGGAQLARIEKTLELIVLADERWQLAGALSHGQKQWLEIGMLLMQEPDLLLVDEPVAGMTDAETDRTADLLRNIARDHSVVVVEHDMEFVRSLNVPVTVLHEGAVLSEGSLQSVQNDERVIEVYLGR
jgi:urea transport system ATP-binding protein